MSFEKKYNEALERAKKLGTFEMPIDPKRSVGEQIFPELAQSKDERIRKWLIGYFNQYIIDDMPQVFSNGLNAKDILAWLEKQGKKSNIPQSAEDELRRQHIIQKLEYLRSLDACNQYGKENINKDIAWLEKKQFNTDIEQVFRPLAGCDIDIAAKQAVEQQKQGKNVVLAFNGCYIPVKDDTADAIVKKYDNWLEKQGKKFKYWNPSKEQLEALDYAYDLCPDTERGNYYEGILETLIADLHKLSEKQDEQKSINKDEPKFHEGDMIIHKELGGDYINNPHKIIQVDMLDKKYRLEGGFVAHFSEQDDYELIEQKPAQNPKFEVGDWVVIENNQTKQIEKIKDLPGGYHQYWTTDDRWFGDATEARLWTIQDAKDGDVLCGYPTDTYPWIGIFHELNDDYIFSSYCYLQAGITGKFCPPSGVNIFNRRNVDEHSSKNVVPATKEQRDFLFQKMKESGYMWEVEKKELKKISQEYPLTPNECCKPAWSEEDENILQKTIFTVRQALSIPIDKERDSSTISWLLSLKDRIQSQPQPKEDIDKPDWVDLGLPSGTLWKSQNETNPNNDNNFYTYDDAVQKFGDQLPTKEQWEELKENCEWIWEGTGYKITGWNGYSIFLPAAGYRGLSGDVKYRGIWGYYWSSVPYDSEDARYFLFDSVVMSVYRRSKRYGLSVRLVKK